MEKSDSLLNTLKVQSNSHNHGQKHLTQKFSFQDPYQIADHMVARSSTLDPKMQVSTFLSFTGGCQRSPINDSVIQAQFFAPRKSMLIRSRRLLKMISRKYGEVRFPY